MYKVAAFDRSVSFAAKTATALITIMSPGWSGKVIKRDAADIEDRSFILDVSADVRNFDGGQNSHGSGGGGYVNYNADGAIIGISLEHFGVYPDGTTYTEGGVQCLGRDSTGVNAIPAYGATETDNALTVEDGGLYVSEYKYTAGQDPEVTQTDISIRYVGNNNYKCFDMPCRIYGNWGAHSTATIITDLPIFATDADLLEYCNSGGYVIDNMLNKSDPQQEYNDALECWYIHNVWGHNTMDVRNYTDYRNYKFYPMSGKICLYKRIQNDNQPYDYGLLNYTGYNVQTGPAFSDANTPYSGAIETNYIMNNARFGANDYYTVFSHDTNIPIFETLDQATDYINDLIDISEALNYADIVRDQSTVIPPEFGEEDAETEIGTNEQAYNIAGFHLYEVSHSELSSFFLEIFDPDPNVTDAILEGTKLFSGNEINAIMSCMYLPISDISKICTMGSTAKITVGTWTADHSEGTRIAKNDVIIPMGSAFFPYVYNSEQDFEPYQQLYVQLPYCGTHQIQISKVIGKTVRCDYAVSVVDGSCKALLFADDILIDEFTGNMGSMRPITAADAAQYVSNVVSGIMDMVPGIGAGASAVKSGVEAASMGGVAGAMVQAGAIATTGVYKGFELLQAELTPPMSTHGSASGAISYFGVQKPHFIICQRAAVRPANEQQVIGYPSGQGGKIGSFSGYLKCSAVKLLDFPGTAKELSDLHDILSKGIYL